MLPGASMVVAAALLAGVALVVDLAPRVEADFFFAPGDPQLRESRELADRYPAGETLIVRAAAPDPTARAYLTRLGALERSLDSIPGVARVFSAASQDPASPLWGRVLTPRGGEATNVVAQLSEEYDPQALASDVQAVLDAHARPDFALAASGVPLIVELIRRGLARDLAVFSTASLIVFGLVAALAYRDARVVAGTLLACLSASAATLLAAAASGIGVGLLTANIATIVFVLTLSHTVFLAANWRDAAEQRGGWAGRAGVRTVETSEQTARQIGRAAEPGERAARNRSATVEAIARTVRPSTWCMLTTLLGFLSLLLAPARPLRELGAAGAVGTIVAFASAFAVLPAWLAGAARRERRAGRPGDALVENGTPATGSPAAGRLRWRGRLRKPATLGRPAKLPALGPVALALLGLAAIGAGTGVWRLDTDPSLLDYFDEAGPIRPGLELVDRDGGSSPLLFAVVDRDGERLDNAAAYDRMWEFHDSLEADAATGIVLSPAPLLAHARAQPLASFLPIPILLELLERIEGGGIASGYLREDRREALYSIRMIEADRRTNRNATTARLAAYAENAGFRVVAAGGLYELQGRLGRLLATSLKVGIGGLLALFVLVGLRVSGNMGGACAMLACLLAIPAVVLGAFGHLGVAIDIVASPAANVALALGVDSMIHIAVRARDIRSGRSSLESAWMAARTRLAKPVATACAIICTGFGMFILSDFPPTRRFGLAVVLGTFTAAIAALFVLPALAHAFRRRRGLSRTS